MKMYDAMVESGSGMFLTTLCVLVTVLQITTREAAEGKPITLDVSRIRINPLECYDRTNSCKEEAQNGYCESNYHYMIDRCPWSCRFCRRAGGDTEKCSDINKHCSKWVSKKECTTRPDFMTQNCKKSCEMCGPESDYNVTDTESTCPIWAKAGWCQSNADLLDKCPHSCQKYGVQGASSLDERYITVNFQKTSPVKNLTVSEIVAPPPPSAAIQSHSDLNLLPGDLKKVLAKEWWDSKLLKLTQKQNEYVTHPELRPVRLPLPGESNQTASNHILNSKQSDQRGINATESGRSKQMEMITVPAPAAPPRAYDALIPKLFLSGGPTWHKGKENSAEHVNTNSTAQGNQEVWKEEKEEDEDLDESGQQKEEVPSGESSGDRDLHVESAASGSGWSNVKGDISASGEYVAHDEDKVVHNISMVFSSSGSGELTEDRNDEGEMVANDENEANDDDRKKQDSTFSGNEEENQARTHHIVAYTPGSGQAIENIKIVLPENDFSGSEGIENQETGDDDISFSGQSGQNKEDESLSMPTSSGSTE